MKLNLLSSLCLVAFTELSASAQGVIQWQNTIGGMGNDQLSSVRQTHDGGYVLAGFSDSKMSGDKAEDSLGITDFWIVKLNDLGFILWQHTYGGSNADGLYSLDETAEGNLIAGGTSASDTSIFKSERSLGFNDYWLVMMDDSGFIQWENTIGGNGNDYLTSVEPVDDGGFIAGGYSDSDISGDKAEKSLGAVDFWVVRLSASGNIMWQNTIGGSGEDELYSLSQTDDGGFILGGKSNSDISGDKSENKIGGHDYWVVKLNDSGSILWQNTLGGSDNDYLTSIKPTPDGGFIAGGYSRSGISGDKTEASRGSFDYWIVKLDSAGSIQWQKTIGGTESDVLNHLDLSGDGGYILGGYSWSGISGDKTEVAQGTYDYWIVKLNARGDIEWQNTIGGDNDDGLNSVQPTDDGGYILGGTSRSSASGDKRENSLGSNDYWVVKLFADSVLAGAKDITASGDNILLYPNPCSSAFTLDYSTLHEKVNSISIISSLGKRVAAYHLPPSNKRLHFSTSGLLSGVFIVELTTERGVILKKVVVD